MARGAGQGRYRLRAVLRKPPERGAPARPSRSVEAGPDAGGGRDPFRRAATEDDDGYDPYSDRPAEPEPRYEEDPWR